MRLLVLTAVLAALAAAGASAQPAPVESTPGEAIFVVSGRGWGHGVGMSQWGAYGLAVAGRTYDEILAHYYTGTEIGRAGRSDVRVLLAEGRKVVTISSSVPFSLVDATGKTHKRPKGALALKTPFELETDDGPVRLPSPVFVRPGKGAPLGFDGNLFRGRLELTAEKGFLRVVNHLPLQRYLEGVVAGEMPHTWPAEALKAQAVAARSYALATLQKGKPFDLYSDVRSQVYRGVAGERPSTTAAVRVTAGEVVTYGGRVATTYYFSTSGGKTASASDVFGFSVPYLVSRPDPWDKASPYHSWGPVLVGARTLQSKLDAGARVLDASGVTTPSGRIRSLSLETLNGAVSVPASLVRTALGLRSTWVTIGVLRLDRPRGVVEAGSPLKLGGIARLLPEPALASSLNGSAWSRIAPLVRQPNGIVSLVVKPSRTTRYRIEAQGATSPAVLVRVAPALERGDP